MNWIQNLKKSNKKKWITSKNETNMLILHFILTCTLDINIF
jgi:hypothetical protein